MFGLAEVYTVLLYPIDLTIKVWIQCWRCPVYSIEAAQWCMKPKKFEYKNNRETYGLAPCFYK